MNLIAIDIRNWFPLYLENMLSRRLLLLDDVKVQVKNAR